MVCTIKRTAMITLQRITDHARLEEYYGFRYRIYADSRQAGFVRECSGERDQDPFDGRAMHFGWYVDDRLAGCIRFIEPDESATPIPMLACILETPASAAVRAHIDERKRRGQHLIEASRFCLLPQHRGPRTSKEFVLAMVRSMRPLGFEEGLFSCDARHAAFYSRLGFSTMEGAEHCRLKGTTYDACVKCYTFQQVLAHQPDIMNAVRPAQHRVAA